MKSVSEFCMIVFLTNAQENKETEAVNLTQKLKLEQIKKHKNLLMGLEMETALSKIFAADSCQNILKKCGGVRDRIYTSTKTILIFIKQVLSADKSCKNAVAEACAEHVMFGQDVSNDTSAYCKARKRLIEKEVHELVKEVASSASKIAPPKWSPLDGREVKVVDGSSLTGADTKENQAAYPQHGNQKKRMWIPLTSDRCSDVFINGSHS